LTLNDAYSVRFSASPFWSVKGKFVYHSYKICCRSGMTHNEPVFAMAGYPGSVTPVPKLMNVYCWRRHLALNY